MNEPIARRHRTLPTDSDARKNVPLHRGLFRYFPAALAEVAKISQHGNDKHNPGEDMHHARGKSMDHKDCILRHLMDSEEGDGRDENGILEDAYLAWRALANLQERLEAEGAPIAPGARFPGPTEFLVEHPLNLEEFRALHGGESGAAVPSTSPFPHHYLLRPEDS